MSDALQSLSDTEKLDWLRLIRSENVGPITFRQLLGRFGKATAALEALPELARRGGRRKPIKIGPKSAAEAEMAAVKDSGAELLALAEPAYPRALAAIDDAPPLISALGHVHLLNKPCIGVIGARNSSAAAVRFTESICTDLGQNDLVVVSGMARGIDAAAHRGSLAGGTVAVLAGGVDVVYPAENEGLYQRIVEEGLAVAEMPMGTKPQARHFPRRNRLISGISLGVLVVEAAPRSGSLITARMALEQGREVFAVPGSPLDPRCRGSNNLIRQGATLVEKADDLLEILQPMLGQTLAEPKDILYPSAPPHLPDEAELAAARGAITEKLGPTAVEIDEMVRQTGYSPAVVLTVLLELELAGQLERHPGGRVSLV